MKKKQKNKKKKNNKKTKNKKKKKKKQKKKTTQKQTQAVISFTKLHKNINKSTELFSSHLKTTTKKWVHTKTTTTTKKTLHFCT